MSERASRSCGVTQALRMLPPSSRSASRARQSETTFFLCFEVKASMACTIASMPVAAVTAAGRPDGQLGVEDRPVGQELRRDDALLLGGAGGDDRDRRHLRAGAGGGRRKHQRQALALDQADAVDVADRLARAGQHRDQLRRVERAAAADRDDAVDALRAAPPRPRRGSSPPADRRRPRRRSRRRPRPRAGPRAPARPARASGSSRR